MPRPTELGGRASEVSLGCEFSFTQLTLADMRDLAAGIVNEAVQQGAAAMLALYDEPFGVRAPTITQKKAG